MIIVYGPTGVGKSELALTLARSIHAEIINMDVGQLYTPFSIGTAKPDWRNESVPHHLFDVINEPRNFTVMEYREALFTLVQEIRDRGAMPILVGGSGFYIKSLFFPPSSDLLTDQNGLPSAIPQGNWDTLHAIDPERARAIQPNDTYRIQRALELWIKTGNKPSAYKPVYENKFGHCHIVHVSRNRDDMYERINDRVHAMFDAGWVAEVEQLMQTSWIPFIEKKKLIGYNEIVRYIKEDQLQILHAPLIEKIQTRTRNYARRQIIFWRMLEKNITEIQSHNTHTDLTMHTINLTSSDHAIYLKQLLFDAKRMNVRIENE